MIHLPSFRSIARKKIISKSSLSTHIVIFRDLFDMALKHLLATIYPCLIFVFVQMGTSEASSSIVWRWDGMKFRGLTTESTPIQESEGGFRINTYNPQASLQFESPNSISSKGVKQQFILVGSSFKNSDLVLYRARSDSVNGKSAFHFLTSA